MKEQSIIYPQLAVSGEQPVMAWLNHDEKVFKEPLYDMHYALETGIVLSGSVIRHCQNHKQLCKPGDIWFSGIWEPHGFSIKRAPCLMLVITVWPPLLINAFFPEAPDIPWMKPFTLPPAERPVMTDESHLHKLFQKHYGQSPVDYRRLLKRKFE